MVHLKKWKKKVKLRLYKFFKNQATIPIEYEVNFICDTLGLPITELDKQPIDWVMKQMTYLSIKGEAEAESQKNSTNSTSKKAII